MPPRYPEFPPVEGHHDGMVAKGTCPKCDMEYGNVTYADGHANCFSCTHRIPTPAAGQPSDSDASAAGEGLSDRHQDRPRDRLIVPPDDGFRKIDQRRLEEATLRRFRYFRAGFKGQTVHVAPYFDQTREPAGQKLRLPARTS